jgi:hypothetical protein
MFKSAIHMDYDLEENKYEHILCVQIDSVIGFEGISVLR